ncbi:peptide/nickel transport system permease protein [Micromonospora sp. Llam0]|uniref:ABC transporter permease n=1 Tax=Micromonospora sp. Llam0 TaxID=2485143 RepID=UPI000F4A5908|nr:ABC transporter permease [Micromonospora sp. Llam0]ROO60455.1 peptide/nickel transport system permease protein [Micromonospora sp. Llam0]
MRPARYVAGRAGSVVLLLMLLSLVVFVGTDVLPGDPVTARLGPGASPQQIEQARERLGLDRPVLDRYQEWAAGLARGDLGTSATGQPVAGMVAGRLANSAVLTATAVVVVIPLSLLVGVLLGARRGSAADRAGSAALLLTVSVPEFVIAAVLVTTLAIGLGLFPAVSLVPAGDSPLAHPEVLVLPVASLVIVSLAYAARIIRAATVTALKAPHVEFLRLNGVAAATVFRQAVLPAILPTAAQVWAVTATSMVGGAVLVELVYGYPGIGALLVTSVRGGDLPVAQAVAMVLGTVTLLGMVAADIAGTVTTRKRLT